MVTRGKYEDDAVKEMDDKKSRVEFSEYAVPLFMGYSLLF